MQLEEWKDIPGYEGLYQASTYGRIRTKYGRTSEDDFHGKRVWKQHILKPKHRKRQNKKKHDDIVDLWKNGSHKTFTVARLVAKTWCDGYEDGMTVNHINGDTTNNRVENLEWLTNKDNVRHGFKNDLFPNQKQCVLVNEKGEKKYFHSMSEASRSIGRSSCYIGNYLLENRQITSSNGEKLWCYLKT